MNEDLIIDKQFETASYARDLKERLASLSSATNEIVWTAIPSLSNDRVIKYIESIDFKIEELGERIKSDKQKIALIESGLRSSLKASFDEKCEWLGKIVINGLEENIDISYADSLLKIIEELSYSQLILLYHYVQYSGATISEGASFRNRFEDLINPAKYYAKDREKYNVLNNKRKLNLVILEKYGLINKVNDLPRLVDFSFSQSNIDGGLNFLKKQLHKLNEGIVEYIESDKYEHTNLGKVVIELLNIKEETLKSEYE